MTQRELRLKAALTAAKWLGTKEGSDGHRRLLALYNTIVPLPRGYRIGKTDPWCAAFVSAAAVEAEVEAIYPLECSCQRIIALAQEMRIWMEDDAHIPDIADWVLYNWDAAKTGDDVGAPDHIGIVIGVRDGRIRVVEGNYDNAVKLRVISVDDARIRGFVCPRFEELAEEAMMKYHNLEEIPAYGQETIRKLTEDGSLLGIAEDDLGLSEDLLRTLVILDRRGVL